MKKYKLNFDGQWTDNDGGMIFVADINGIELSNMEYIHMKNVLESLVDKLNKNDNHISLMMVEESLYFNDEKGMLYCPQFEVVKEALEKLNIEHTITY